MKINELDLEELLELALYHFRSEGELLNAVATLRENFIARKNSDYLQNENLIAAYTCFYLPTNYVKLAKLFNLLPSAVTSKFAHATFVDMGTGPGTFAFAFSDYFNGCHHEIFGIDSSPLMLQQARKIKDRYYCQNSIKFLSSLADVPIKSPIVLCFGHSLNESGINFAWEEIQKISPDWVLLLEPGTTSVFLIVLRLRNILLDHGYDTVYPCLAPRDACPLYGENDWCHQIFHASHHPSLERISQKLHMDRKKLPIIAHLYQKRQVGEQLSSNGISVPKEGRIIRVLDENKFAFNLWLCGRGILEHMPGLSIFDVEIWKKHLTREQKRFLDQIFAGASLKFDVLKVMADRRLRIRICSH